jgi:hypothetical protein
LNHQDERLALHQVDHRGDWRYAILSLNSGANLIATIQLLKRLIHLGLVHDGDCLRDDQRVRGFARLSCAALPAEGRDVLPWASAQAPPWGDREPWAQCC